ncbi:MAG: HAMP domain-containing histidine kinase [Clostridia bacterium]|nr:HAMP domain-containing histidine kinase [Clostridia bacterium]MBR1827293.1 HAMP domain-containing histidine kinase [Clostridia bacterium]
MIERIRKRFIHVTILSVLVALLLIMGTFNFVAFRSVQTNADLMLDLMANNGGDFPDRIPDEYKGIIEGFGNAAAYMDDDFEGEAPEDGNRYFNNGVIQGERHRTFSAVTDETPYEARYFSVVLDDQATALLVNTGRIASVNAEDATRYARSLQHIGATETGFLGVYRYRVQPVENGTMYLFLDCSSELYNSIYMLILSLMIAGAALLLISMMVILFSKRAIRPIEESYDKQRKFITNAGHELKTPLAIIDSCTEVLEMTEGENKWTEGIHEQVGRLTTMTAELISMAKMAESDLELNKRELNLSDLCRETLEPFGLMAEEQGLGYVLDITPDIPFFGNEQTLKQLCSILADNAVKYAVPGTTIYMTLKKRGRRVHLSSDNAAEGVKKGNRNELFERFYRGDTSHSQEKKGYGIGLSMAETITELHNGRISANSEDGERLKITVSFPERGGSARAIRKVTRQQEKYHKKNAGEQENRIAKA